MTENLCRAIYALVAEQPGITCTQASERLKERREALVAVIKSLETMDVLSTQLHKETSYQLTTEGEAALTRGTPEYRLLCEIVRRGGMTTSEDLAPTPFTQKELSIAVAGALRQQWIHMESEKASTGKSGVQTYRSVIPLFEAVDEIRECLRAKYKGKNSSGKHTLDSTKVTEDEIKLLKRNKYIQVVEEKDFVVVPGPRYASGLQKQEADLTIEMVHNYIHKTGKPFSEYCFKPYNFSALGAPLQAGAYHPLYQMRSFFVNVFVSLGFEQMSTDRWVESSFWNFDALFQPQSHPARDAQDTFFVGGRYKGTNLNAIPTDLIEKVSGVHEKGDKELYSRGYSYRWSLDEALKNVLRTHTTAVSARVLYEIGRKFRETGEFTPRRFFSIDRVFRNETLDATHLCEFHQIEGMVIDKDLSLAHLIATLRAFFSKLGMTKLNFKPTYNPYTAPSMEIFAFHPQLKRWIEVGNSGIFRPEVVSPLGLPSGIRVIAWGLSLERPTMIVHGVSNIRDLIGPGTSFELIHQCGFFTPILEAK